LLVVFQFAISVFLIIGTGIISQQIDFMQNRRLGFDKERVIIVELRNDRLRDEVQEIMHEMSRVPAVSGISASTMNPGGGTDGSAYFPEGKSSNDPWLIFHAGVDYRYIETMGMSLIRGRNFSKEFKTDSSAVIINKTLWEKLGWGDEVLGKKFRPNDPMNTFSFEVVGVVDDFHVASLHEQVEPFIFHLRKTGLRNICIRLQPGDVSNHLTQIEKKWNQLEPDFPFEYRFLDQTFNDLYQSEVRLSKMYIYFSIVAIFIACLGLFGLSSFLAEQRTKEIGIRKTFGATAGNLSLMLTRDFTKWISLSNLIAWPVAFYLMDKWLSQFAYRIRIIESWDVFVYAAVISYLIAVITVSFQAFRAASINPADSLKYE
jgi:putative ABC transport system permease protein